PKSSASCSAAPQPHSHIFRTSFRISAVAPTSFASSFAPTFPHADILSVLPRISAVARLLRSHFSSHLAACCDPPLVVDTDCAPISWTGPAVVPTPARERRRPRPSDNLRVMRRGWAAVCVLGACTSGDAGTAVDAEASTGDATTTDAPTEHPPSTTDDPGTTTTSGSDTIPGATTTPRDDTSQGTTTASTDRGTSTQPSSTDEDGSESSTGVPPMNATCRDDHRVVAFVANWQACPTAEQLAAYSHVVVAFAVTYTWTESGNLCDPECTLQPVEGCSGTSLAALVETLHAQGQEVLV